MAAVPSAVLLVRHAMPDVDAAVDGTLWPLSDKGRAAARALGRRLAPRLADGVVIAGDERKMVETADALVAEIPTASTRAEPRVGEVRRPWIDDGDYAAVAVRYLKGEAIDGWESQQAVRSRLDAALMGHGDGRAVCVTGGLAMTVWLASMWPDLDVETTWRDLTFPDAWLLDLERGQLQRIGF